MYYPDEALMKRQQALSINSSQKRQNTVVTCNLDEIIEKAEHYVAAYRELWQMNENEEAESDGQYAYRLSQNF